MGCVVGTDGDKADYICFDFVNEAIGNPFYLEIIGTHVSEVSFFRLPGPMGVLQDSRDMSRHDLVQERLVVVAILIDGDKAGKIFRVLSLRRRGKR